MAKPEPQEVVMGRNLAETAALNAPERVAGKEAAAAVQRAVAERESQARNRGGFKLAVLVMSVIFASVGIAAWAIGD